MACGRKQHAGSALALALAQIAVSAVRHQAAHTVYELAITDVFGRLDYASIAQLWEGLTNRSLCKTAE
jgi:hypothetical protein